MSDIVFVGTHPSRRVRFAPEPIYNALCSLCLLSQNHLDRISGWVDVTRQHLTDDERKQAQKSCHVAPLVAIGGHDRANGSGLPAWLDELAATDTKQIREANATRLREKATRHFGLEAVPTLESLTGDRESYVELVRRICVAKNCEEEFDRAEEEAIFDSLRDGGSYRDDIVECARHLWEKYLSDEWDSVAATVEKSVRAFESIQIPGETVVDQLKFITEREVIPEDWVSTLEIAEEVVFVPSVHIGPFMILFEYDGHTAYVVGRARIPAGSAVHADELDRSDLLIRLEALSDGSRLRVLELASERGTITTQDVMDKLELSQSSASRHLTQLTATGLLAVDASERTKRYRVNGGRIDQVFSGLKDLLGTKERV